MLCVKCATPNPDTNRFCSTCGEPLNAGSGDTETGSGLTKTFATPAAPPGTLAPGSILGGRYRILETLGMGGMGMVYKAVDLELEVPVALKVIRAEYATNDKIFERFKKEITIARRVTHRNVARIYDFGDSEGVKYISMEFIEGKDLAHIIEHDGALPAEKVISILRQCCAALSEAHAAGVVHRDLKPHNVMIDANGDVRLMDFGIALSQETKGLTRTGAIIGTPEYMSPEQAEGKRVDHRADIYSLGITIYEALTGVVPFSGATQWEVIRRQIQDRARPPRKLRSEIPAWVETLVLKCLEKDPALRYQSVDEIVRDIDRQKATRAMMAYAPKKRTVAYVTGAIVLAAAAVAVTLLLRPRGIVVGPGGRTSLAVLPFENQTGRGDLDWLRTGLAENLSTDLGQSKYFRILTRERLGQILKDLGRTEGGPFDADALSGIAEYGGVQAVVTGSYIGSGDVLRINLRVQDPESGEAIGSTVVPGSERELLAMIDQLTLRTKEILSISQEKIAQDVDTAIASARTSSIEAASLFQRGLDLMYQGRNLEAIEPFQQATSKDPDFALAWAQLSKVYSNLGHDEKAKEAGDNALSRVLKAIDKVTPADRAQIRAAHAAAAHNGQEAIDAYEEMVKADPYDATAEYQLGLAYEGTGEWDKAEVHFRKALEVDPKYALAQVAVGRIKLLSGHAEASLPEFEKVLEIYRKVGSQEGEATVYQAICNAHIELRHWEEALTYCSKSASIKEAIGDTRGLAASLGSKSYVFQVTGRLEEALDVARKDLDLLREIGDTRGTALALTNVASILEDRGDLLEALKAREEALELARSVQDVAGEAEILQNIGSLRVQLGDLRLSESSLSKAAELYQDLGIMEGLAQVISDRGILALRRGELQTAEDQLDRAGSQWKSLNTVEGISETQYRQSMVALRRARYGSTETLVRQALADYERAGDKLNIARCRLVLGTALLRSGDSGGAAREIESGLEAARALGNPILLGALEAARDEIHLAAGAAGDASPLADSVCRRASAARVPQIDLACSLLKARTALAAGRAAEASSLAGEAASKAAASGLGLDAMDAALMRLRAQVAGGDGGAAQAGTALVEKARKAGAEEVLLQAAPLTAVALVRAGRAEDLPALIEMMEASFRSARADLPASRSAAFVKGGTGAVEAAQAAEALRKAGRSADADRIAALLRP